jgi:hypothetical protein
VLELEAELVEIDKRRVPVGELEILRKNVERLRKM